MLNRKEYRQKVKELAHWEKHVAPLLAEIEKEFQDELFNEENESSYADLYTLYSIKYVKAVRLHNHNYRFIKGEETAFLTKYLPMEKGAA